MPVGWNAAGSFAGVREGILAPAVEGILAPAVGQKEAKRVKSLYSDADRVFGKHNAPIRARRISCNIG